MPKAIIMVRYMAVSKPQTTTENSKTSVSEPADLMVAKLLQLRHSRHENRFR